MQLSDTQSVTSSEVYLIIFKKKLNQKKFSLTYQVNSTYQCLKSHN